MEALAESVGKAEAGRLVIELGDPVRNQRDVRIIQPRFHAAGVHVAYSHESPGSFPGLEIADGLAWAYGAGTGWRRMIWPMVEIAPEIGG